jgi:hypothetical protein
MSLRYVSLSKTDENADYLPIQWMLLAVISGVVALCVGGFSIWHILYISQTPLIKVKFYKI